MGRTMRRTVRRIVGRRRRIVTRRIARRGSVRRGSVRRRRIVRRSKRRRRIVRRSRRSLTKTVRIVRKSRRMKEPPRGIAWLRNMQHFISGKKAWLISHLTCVKPKICFSLGPRNRRMIL